MRVLSSSAMLWLRDKLVLLLTLCWLFWLRFLFFSDTFEGDYNFLQELTLFHTPTSWLDGMRLFRNAGLNFEPMSIRLELEKWGLWMLSILFVNFVISFKQYNNYGHFPNSIGYKPVPHQSNSSKQSLQRIFGKFLKRIRNNWLCTFIVGKNHHYYGCL